MAKYELTSKNYNKLVKFAQQQGLEVHHQMKAEAVIETIQRAFPGASEVDLIEDDEPAAVETAPVISGETGGLTTHYRDDPMVTVNIPSDPENGGSRPVPICVNGDFIWVKRNTDVAIPYRFFLSLKNAMQTDYRQEQGENNTTLLVGEDRHAFRFNVIEPASRAAIAAWHERTKDIGRDKSEIESLKPDQQDSALDAIAAKLFDRIVGAGQAQAA